VAADLYQSLGRGFEASVGMRRLAFSSNTDIYLGTLTKYVGNWMITGKVFSVPDFEGPEDSLSYHGLVRRYIRGDGESFLSAGYSRGSSREELTDSAEQRQLDPDPRRRRGAARPHDGLLSGSCQERVHPLAAFVRRVLLGFL
jgi:YaiO family outer membrane protein